jgi:hypothetical protein
MMREQKVYCYRRQFASATDKPSRAQAIRARMAMGKVYLPRNAAWLEPLLTEMLTFPSAKHDDQVDVLSLFGRMLDSMAKGKEPEKPKPLIDTTPKTMGDLKKELLRQERKREEERSYD